MGEDCLSAVDGSLEEISSRRGRRGGCDRSGGGGVMFNDEEANGTGNEKEREVSHRGGKEHLACHGGWMGPGRDYFSH